MLNEFAQTNDRPADATHNEANVDTTERAEKGDSSEIVAKIECARIARPSIDMKVDVKAEQFGQYVTNSLEKIQYESNRRLLELKIQKAIIEFESRDLGVQPQQEP